MQTKLFAITIFFVFLIVLFTLSQTIETKIVKIEDITTRNIDERIKIIGNIDDILQKANVTIITINDSTGVIPGIIYEPISLGKNIQYSFEGKIKEYNQELELEIEEIKEVY